MWFHPGPVPTGKLADNAKTQLAKRYAAEIIRCAITTSTWTRADLPRLTEDDYDDIAQRTLIIADGLILAAGEDGADAWYRARIDMDVTVTVQEAS